MVATQEALDFDRKFITSGWRGNIFRRENYCLKKAIDERFTSNIQREILILTKIQDCKIAGIPRLYNFGQNWFISDWIEGLHFDAAREQSRFLKKSLALQLLKIAYDLDSHQIEHGELHRPMSNVLVDTEGKVWLIDFDQGGFGNHKNKNLRHLAQWMQSLGLIAVEDMRILGSYHTKQLYDYLSRVIGEKL